MNNHSPRTNFQKFYDTVAGEWRASAPTAAMQRILDSALAEFAHRGCSTDELNGVNRFIGVLLNLAEPDAETVSQYPVRELKTYQTKE